MSKTIDIKTTYTDGVTVSPRAMERITHVLAQRDEKSAVRVWVEGGGCSGFRYVFAVVDAPEHEDILVGRLAVDKVSMPYLAGSQVDWVEAMIGASFQVINPQASASCGCGMSFALAAPDMGG